MASSKGSGFANGDFKQKDKKSALDHMMQECTNRIAKEKYQPQSFHHKIASGKTSQDSHHGPHSLPSGSANVNFSSLPGKNLKPTGLPLWCCTEQVPALYRHIENYATSNGAHEISNNLLLPILLSSGLNRVVLGLIWEMTNKMNPGVLTKEELYATLAVVALYQAGYPVQNLEALHFLPCPPVPVLRFPALAPQGPSDIIPIQPPVAQSPPLPIPVTIPTRLPQASFVGQPIAPLAANVNPHLVAPTIPIPRVPILTDSTFTSQFPSNAGVASILRSNLVHPEQTAGNVNPAFGNLQFQTVPNTGTMLGNPQFESSGPRVSSQQNGVGDPNGVGGFSNVSDDDFADFQSSGTMQLNQSNSDDFDDFKTADTSVNIPQFRTSVETSPKTVSSLEPIPFQISLLNNLSQSNGSTKSQFNVTRNNVVEDKYAVFKSIEIAPDPPMITEMVPECEESHDVEETSNTDEFGDFLGANVVTPTQSSHTTSSESPIEFVQTVQSPISQNASDEAFYNYSNYGQSNHSNMGLKNFSDKGSVNSLESPVYLYESDNLDALSISSFHHSPGRSRKVYTEDDISFDKISVGPPGGDGSNDHSAAFSTSSHESSSTETGEQVDYDSTSVNAIPLADRYSFIRSQTPVCLDKVAIDWLRCLEKCRDILDEARSTFYFACNELSHESLEELFETDEIGDYLENVTEVFCIVRRIYASSLASGRYTGNIQVALNENDLIWEELAGGISSFYKLPEKMKLDFSSAILSPTTETLSKSCGVCLLDVDANCGIFGEDECVKLTYGGRQYHSSCANVWVNCVDLLLPALQNAELL